MTVRLHEYNHISILFSSLLSFEKRTLHQIRHGVKCNCLLVFIVSTTQLNVMIYQLMIRFEYQDYTL